MKITTNTVVSMHYTLTNDDGTQLDSSRGKEPLVFLQGYQNIIPGLEKEMEGKEKGETFTATISPEMAYGERVDQLVQALPKSNFPDPNNLQVGMQFQASSEAGPLNLTVVEVKDDTVTVDGNHPLAGVTLNFDVEVMDVRAATEEEIAHKHVHQ